MSKIQQPKEGYLTIEGIEYYFDGSTAYPVKCKCKGHILQVTNEYPKYQFNDNTKEYDIIYDTVEGDFIEYHCGDCFTTYNTKEFFNGEWD